MDEAERTRLREAIGAELSLDHMRWSKQVQDIYPNDREGMNRACWDLMEVYLRCVIASMAGLNHGNEEMMRFQLNGIIDLLMPVCIERYKRQREALREAGIVNDRLRDPEMRSHAMSRLQEIVSKARKADLN